MYHMNTMKLHPMPCYCATLRQAARVVTTLYEEILADSGVPATQFTMIQVLKTAPGLQTTEVANLIGIDQTTATRTLALMKKTRLVAAVSGVDRRERRWRLTPLGETLFREIQTKWESAQRMIERRLGKAEAIALKNDAFHAASTLTSPSS
jgi:DNA-binding MarR family transcriptional regulator